MPMRMPMVFGKIIYPLKKGKASQLLERLVPRAGVEPARACTHGCLRPARLPIPPSGQFKIAMQN